MGMTSSRTLTRQSAQATARQALPAPGERRRLREMWGLTPQQVGVAFGVRAATVRSWESGRSTPTGQRREAYRRFLQGLAQRTDIQPRAASLPATRRPDSAVRPYPAVPAATAPEAEPAEPSEAEQPSLRAEYEAPVGGWLPRAGVAVVVVSGWVLMLVLLDAYLPGWAG